jgi:hypothetical protein
MHKCFSFRNLFLLWFRGSNAVCLVCQPDVYLCSINDVTIAPTIRRRARAGLFSGEVSLFLMPVLFMYTLLVFY